MEGFVAAHGGRVLKSGLLAFGTLISAAPAMAQTVADPLAPLPVAQPGVTVPSTPQVSAPVPASTQLTSPLSAVAKPPVPAPAVRIVVPPKDWRGVFDAIDAGDW